jgi:hypothetical protein
MAKRPPEPALFEALNITTSVSLQRARAITNFVPSRGCGWCSQAKPTYPFNSSLAQMSLLDQEINQLKTW